MTNTAVITKLAESAAGVRFWALDFPQREVAAKVTERGLYVQGWVLARPDVSMGDIVIRTGEASSEIAHRVPFSNGRPDVIQRVLGMPSAGHPQLRCGFIAHLADVPQDFTIGVEVNGATSWLCRVQLDAAAAPFEAPKPQVIQGTDGWLFLDNDTNRSVDQYTGRLTLDSAGLARWQDYLDGTCNLAAAAGARHAVLVAASKEQVLPEHYPHQKGVLTVHEQVLGLCRPEHHVVDTAALLAAQADKEACFIKTDSHWTDRGAKLAVLDLLRELGLDAAQARQHLASDIYFTVPFSGDLGVKLSPAVQSPTEFLQGATAASDAVFDNQLPNIGRVLIFACAEVLWPQTLLIFGASSSYPMLKYLKRLFGRIVFVHSAGNVDQAIVRHECPDFLVVQTTARFMIEAPDTAFGLGDAVARKVACHADARASAAAPAATQTHPRNHPYQRMLDLKS